MIYVYCRNIKSGREDFSGSYATWADAINRIKQLYNMDANMKTLGEYYYFAKER